MFGLDTDLTILLVACLLCACIFEFINGFHDTANAVATVIYTNSLKPTIAVVWSGIWNFLGVLLGGTAVAMGIMKLIPPGMVIQLDIAHNVILVLSILFSAIIWNLGTWYFGLPCSSSHTLIGSMLGVGIAYTWFLSTDEIGSGVNWAQAGKVGVSLLVSPALGFALTFFLMKFLRVVIKKKEPMFVEPKKKSTPPWLVRVILIITCTLVSFFHGSNDGQKGVGLIMLILIAIVPARFALDMNKNPIVLKTELSLVDTLLTKVDPAKLTDAQHTKISKAKSTILEINGIIGQNDKLDQLPTKDRLLVREHLVSVVESLNKTVVKSSILDKSDSKALKSSLDQLKQTTEHVPNWVVLIISISLGLGTMIGWKRIVKTIGEKIGKEHLTYAQGASAELVAATTIGIASATGLPVSTTQVLSSGIAGSMVASGGTKNLQSKTVKNIFIAWMLTLPITMLMAGGLFWIMSQFL